MKAQKLPSGNWRVRIYIGEENGKKKWKSVTRRTKEDAIRAAVMYEPSNGATVLEACEEYLELKSSELSPSTVRGYKATLERYIRGSKIAPVKLSMMTSAKAQEWVSKMKGLSQKSKANHFGFLSAAVSFFMEDKRLHVRIGRTSERELYTPTIDEVNAVLACSDEVVRRAICLACFGLRRGEICALTADDIQGNNVVITKALAKTTDNTFVTKVPKTAKSRRIVPISPNVAAMMPKKGKIIPCSPDSLTNRFAHAVERAGVHHFRFHDLRSFFASISLSSAVGSGAKTVQDLGGWETDRILKSHYERTISDIKQRDIDAIISYFSDNLETNTRKGE